MLKRNKRVVGFYYANSRRARRRVVLEPPTSIARRSLPEIGAALKTRIYLHERAVEIYAKALKAGKN